MRREEFRRCVVDVWGRGGRVEDYVVAGLGCGCKVVGGLDSESFLGATVRGHAADLMLACYAGCLVQALEEAIAARGGVVAAQ